MDRRGFLATVTATAATGLAGCARLRGGDDGQSADGVEYELQSDRIYRSGPVRTAAGLVLGFTYAIGDSGYRFEDDDGGETVLFPANGWFLKTSVNWLWEGSVPPDWRLDPAAFRLVVNGEYFEPLSELPRDVEWDAVLGAPADIPPHFAGGAVPGWGAAQGRVNFLFDTSADPSLTYYLEWTPSDPVEDSTEPVFLTSSWGPHVRGEAPEDVTTGN